MKIKKIIKSYKKVEKDAENIKKNKLIKTRSTNYLKKTVKKPKSKYRSIFKKKNFFRKN